MEMAHVPDGAVILVYLAGGFCEAIRKDLQRFLDRQVNLVHLPPNTTQTHHIRWQPSFQGDHCLNCNVHSSTSSQTIQMILQIELVLHHPILGTAPSYSISIFAIHNTC